MNTERQNRYRYIADIAWKFRGFLAHNNTRQSILRILHTSQMPTILPALPDTDVFSIQNAAMWHFREGETPVLLVIPQDTETIVVFLLDEKSLDMLKGTMDSIFAIPSREFEDLRATVDGCTFKVAELLPEGH